jgi:hypothetical protein
MREDAATPGPRAATGPASGPLRYVQWTPVIVGALAAAALSSSLGVSIATRRLCLSTGGSSALLGHRGLSRSEIAEPAA